MIVQKPEWVHVSWGFLLRACLVHMDGLKESEGPAMGHLGKQERWPLCLQLLIPIFFRTLLFSSLQTVGAGARDTAKHENLSSLNLTAVMLT